MKQKRYGLLSLTTLAILAAPLLCRAQGVISTVAGMEGPPGTTGDGGPATRASLWSPTGVAVDSAGNIYIAQGGDNRVRKVDTAGTITTVAGNGSLLFSGDGGPATNAGLRLAGLAGGIAVDRLGNLFIADSSLNNRIRKVDTSGIINTVAGNGFPGFGGDGGLATSASINRPNGVALDSGGNLYIADTLNARARKVDTAGRISTVAGSGALGFSGDGGPATGAAFNAPVAVAVDGGGNLFIADQTAGRVRKVDTAGIITTVAGNGTPGFSGDGGPAVGAQFLGISGIAVDGAGNLYIADRSNNRIRKVDTAGIISTVAGSGVSGFSGDGGQATSARLSLPNDVAVDTSGNLYIADTVNNRIRKVSGSAPPPGGSPPIISPNGVVNGASFQPGIVPNSWATILGSNLAPTTGDWGNSIINGRFPTTLGGVSVSIGPRPAYIYYISPTQINVLVPDVGSGPLPVVVTTPSGTSAAFTVTSNSYAPAFFLWLGGQAVATRQDFSLAAKAGTFSGLTTIPAKPGDSIILWGTGFGPTNPVAPVGVQVPGDRTYLTATQPAVTINNIPATVFGAALSPGYGGLYQVAIQVPNSLADGDWPVQASIGGVQSAVGVVLSVRK